MRLTSWSFLFEPKLPGEASLALHVSCFNCSGRDIPTSLHHSSGRLPGPKPRILPRARPEQAQGPEEGLKNAQEEATRRARPFHRFRRQRVVPALASGASARQATVGVCIGRSVRGLGNHEADGKGTPGPGVQPTGKVTLQAAALTYSCRWGPRASGGGWESWPQEGA